MLANTTIVNKCIVICFFKDFTNLKNFCKKRKIVFNKIIILEKSLPLVNLKEKKNYPDYLPSINLCFFQILLFFILTPIVRLSSGLEMHQLFTFTIPNVENKLFAFSLEHNVKRSSEIFLKNVSTFVI